MIMVANSEFAESLILVLQNPRASTAFPNPSAQPRISLSATTTMPLDDITIYLTFKPHSLSKMLFLLKHISCTNH